MEPLQTTYRPRTPIDLRATVASLQRGPGDPTQRVSGGVIWRAVRTPAGPATLALTQQADGSVRAAAWGGDGAGGGAMGRDDAGAGGAGWAIAQVPALCGGLDSLEGFDASLHPVIEASFRRAPGLRIPRSDLPFTAFAQAVIEQKVTVRQAFRAWRRLVTWFGERAPGPVSMFVPPGPEVWRTIPSWSWHKIGLEPPQAKTLAGAGARASALQRAIEWGGGVGGRRTGSSEMVPFFGEMHPDAPQKGAGSAERGQDPLLAFPGVGPWTAAETRIRAFGDPDAVSIGDFHLPHHVGYALAGARTDDDGMLELLEPWRGHRQRVIRLIMAAGAGEPRRAPRLHEEDHTGR